MTEPGRPMIGMGRFGAGRFGMGPFGAGRFGMGPFGVGWAADVPVSDMTGSHIYDCESYRSPHPSSPARSRAARWLVGRATAAVPARAGGAVRVAGVAG